MPGAPDIAVLLVLLAFVLGFAVGPALNYLAWSITRRRSGAHARPCCNACEYELDRKGLLVRFAALPSRAACTACGVPIEKRFWAISPTCAIACAGIVAFHGPALETVELVLFAALLLVVCMTDLECRLVPDGCVIACLCVRIAYLAAQALFFQQDISQELADCVLGAAVIVIAAIIVVLATNALLGKPSLGGGDLKLFGLAGLYFGLAQGVLVVFIACLAGVATAAAGAIAGRDEQEHRFLGREIPFGPSIALACWVVMLVGPAVIACYFGAL